MADQDTLPQGAEKVARVRAMFDAIAPRYDLVNRVMTLGLDVGWRRRAVASLRLQPGAVVLDVGCGTGDLCRVVDARGGSAVGVDLSWEMLANRRAASSLVQGDALRLPVRGGSVDAAVSGFVLRNVRDLDLLFAELARVLRRGGPVALLEVAEPRSRLLRAGHRVYFGKAVPLIGGLLSDRAAYRYLPRSVAYLPEPGELLARLADSGFVAVERRLLSGGIVQLVTGTRK